MMILVAKIKIEAQPLKVAVVAVSRHLTLCEERSILVSQFRRNVNHQELSNFIILSHQEHYAVRLSPI